MFAYGSMIRYDPTLVCLIDFLYIPVNNFSIMRDVLPGFEPVLIQQGLMCLAQGNNEVTLALNQALYHIANALYDPTLVDLTSSVFVIQT